MNKTRIRGGTTTVQVTETTTLTYDKIRGDEPATTGFKAHHRLTFTVQPDGTWKLTALRSSDRAPRRSTSPSPRRL
ncbi:hypothetical protein ACFWP5_16470 [Streptomyces sp. NPDC058469]|uniref:hypothetical protein n=1 Tax=Streptomyces sp. NPDC058469 TaxID=3346514 RepID=UPI0036698DF5